MINKIVTILNRYLILRYAISGGLASALDVFLFAFLIEIFSLHYIISAIISTSVSFVVKFYLQKIFTFRNKNSNINRQIITYSLLYVFGIIMTTSLLYLFIDIFNIWYMPAQIMAIITVASVSFFIYKYIVFNSVDKDIIRDSGFPRGLPRDPCRKVRKPSVF